MSSEFDEEPTVDVPVDDRMPVRCCVNGLVAVRRSHAACLEGMEMTRLRVKDENGETAMHVAARLDNVQAGKLLLQLCPDMARAESASGETPPLLAAALGHTKTMEVLLKLDVNSAMDIALIRDMNGTSILMAATVRGDNDLAFWLLRRFGKPLAMLPNKVNMLPIHVAASQGNIEFIRIVTKYDNGMVHSKDDYGCTPAFYAVQGGCVTCTRYLIEKCRANPTSQSKKGQSLLHVACLSGHEQIVRFLLNRSGPSIILVPTRDNANAIHCAAYSGKTNVLSMLMGCFSKKKRKEALAMRDSRGNAPLHLTAINNQEEAAMYLIEAGAESQLLNAAGQTAREIALLRGHNHLASLLAVSDRKRKRRASVGPLSTRALSMQDLSSPNTRTPLGLRPPTANQMRNHSAPYTAANMPTSYYSPIHIGVDGRMVSPNGKMQSPHALSSGYSSAGESHELGPELVRRRMTYVEDTESDKRESGAQTEDDLLEENIKYVDDKTWMDEGLVAVAHIDRVLKEVEETFR